MKVIAQQKAGTAAGEENAIRLESTLDMALCTIIPKDGGSFSIQLPLADWEDGLQAAYAFTYDGKAGAGEAVLPATMQVVPVLQNFESHCTDATDGKITEDCILRFETGRAIDIASDVIIQLSGEEIGRLNSFLEQWNRR
jgi:hypothetical protein